MPKAIDYNVDVSSVEDAFHVINSRQISALMMHDEMADLFDFLGLMGFKRMHEYQYFAESAKHRGIKRYYLNHHNKLLPHEKIERVSVIPEDWMRYSRKDVTPSIRKQSVQTAFGQYTEWEYRTKSIYEKVAASLLNLGYTADFNKVNDLVKDVDMEIKRLDRLCLSLRSVDYDPMYFVTIQDKLHEEYDKRTQEIGIAIC